MCIRDFVKLLQKCNVVYSANSNAPEKEKEDEVVADAANTTQEENVGMILLDWEQYPQQKLHKYT